MTRTYYGDIKGFVGSPRQSPDFTAVYFYWALLVLRVYAQLSDIVIVYKSFEIHANNSKINNEKRSLKKNKTV